MVGQEIRLKQGKCWERESIHSLERRQDECPGRKAIEGPAERARASQRSGSRSLVVAAVEQSACARQWFRVSVAQTRG